MKLLVVGLIVAGSCAVVSCSPGEEHLAKPPRTGAATTAMPATTADRCPRTSVTIATEGFRFTVDGTTSFADIIGTGPQSLTLTLANYPIAERDARGVLQPSGLEDGKGVVVITATAPQVAAGSYLDQTDNKGAEKEINFFSIWTSRGRALPTAHHELTLTEVGDKVCGRIQPVEESTGASASGTFVARRIDSGPTTRMTSPRGSSVATTAAAPGLTGPG